MYIRLHVVAVLLAAAGLSAACQVSSPQRADDGGEADSGTLANSSRRGKSSAAAKPRDARPAAAPAPTPRPRVVVVVPTGTTLSITLDTALSSDANHEGDLVMARLAEDVRVRERVVLRAGSEVRGRVTAAVGSGRVKGRARLAAAFDSVEVGDRRYTFKATSIDITAGSTRKRDAAMIGGGALVGAVVDGKKGAGIGALLGGGAVLATKGKEVKLPAGTPVTLTLERDLRLD